MIEEDRAGRARDRRIEVAYILEDDVGRFPSKLETYLLQIPGRRADNDLADLG